MLSGWFKIPLWQRVIGALILGVIAGRLWGPDAASIKTVSYTHLTLPTICSV